MPLRVKIPAGEKIIINGAVVENAGETTVMVFHNHADILRRKEIMQESEAVTPARRVYFALQCAYLFEQDRASYLEKAAEFMRQYNDAAPSSTEILQEVSLCLKELRLYDALKKSRALLDHESERMDAVRSSFKEAQAKKSSEKSQSEKDPNKNDPNKNNKSKKKT